MSIASFLRENARFLTAGSLISFTSSYGQTYFIAIFSAQIMAAYGLSDGQWGLLYTLSTTASAIAMIWAGTLTDRFRVNKLALVVIPGLSLACLAMAGSTSVVLLILTIFGLRFFGQGMMSQLAVTAMARWFVARRGLALSITSVGFAIGQSIFPAGCAALLVFVDWRWLWVVAAGLALMILPIVLNLLRKERTPQSLSKESNTTGMDNRHWTRGEVLRSPIFWLLVPMLLGPPSWGTALFFQQVHIAEVKGWALPAYLGLLPLLTAAAVTTTLISGQLIDRFGSAALIRAYMPPFAIAFAILSGADSLSLAAIALCVFGIGSGLQGTVVTAFWSEYYGTAHIGSIKAVSVAIMVFGSAIGPGISGVLIDAGYDFPRQMLAIAVYFVGAAALAWMAAARARRALARPLEVDVERA